MTYKQFLAACRRLAGYDNKSEFARHLKLKRVNHYIGCETGKRRPSLELLEKAAAAAKLNMQDCIDIPVAEQIVDERRNIIKEFMDALDDDKRTAAARLAVIQLMGLKNGDGPRGGRGRKPKR